MLSHEKLLDVRAAAFADDIPILDEMLTWSETEAEAYFCSGGATRPPAQSPPASTGLEANLAALALPDSAVHAIIKDASSLRDLLERKDNRAVLDRLKAAGVQQLGMRQKVVNVIQHAELPKAADTSGVVCGPDGCTLPPRAEPTVAPIHAPAAPAPAPAPPPPPPSTPAPAPVAEALAPLPAPSVIPDAVIPERAAPEPAAPEPAAPAAKCVLTVRCESVALKLTLSPKLLERPFSAAVVEPFLKALAKKGGLPVSLADVAAATIEGARVPAADFGRASHELLQGVLAAKVELTLTAEAAAAGKGSRLPRLPSEPPPPPLTPKPVPAESVGAIRRAGDPAWGGDALGARFRTMSVAELKATFARHLLAPPAHALSKEELVDALVGAPRPAPLVIEVTSDVV